MSEQHVRYQRRRQGGQTSPSLDMMVLCIQVGQDITDIKS